MIALLDLNNTSDSDPEVNAWWARKDPALSEIARRWWEVMKGCGDDVREALHNGYPAACLDLYPYAYVDAFTAHVNVGFYCGADLEDPSGLLMGTGKRMRHVKVFPGEAFDEDALEALIRQSYRDMKEKLAER